MGVALKDAKNPFFKSKFADLNSVIDASIPVLNTNGITVLQPQEHIDGRNFVKTILMHSSGEWIASYTEVLSQKVNDPQAQGSGISYARRYGLQSLVVLKAEDTDAEGAMDRSSQPAPRNYVAPRIVENKVESKPQAVAMPTPVAPTGGFKSAKITKVENEEF